MDRRRFLATATAATALPLAGCSAVGLGRTDLRPVDETSEPDETYLRFEHGGRELLTFSTRHLAGYDESAGQIPLEFGVPHAEDTRIEGFRIGVRAPADGTEPRTTAALETPWFGDAPSLDFYRTDDRETVVGADGLGEYGDGTLSLSLLLDPREMPDRLPVRVRGRFDLSEEGPLGRKYRAEGRMTVGIDRERDP